MTTGTIQENIRIQELQAQAFADVKSRIENFDRSSQDAREFYLNSILTWLSGMTDGEVDLLTPLIREKLGIEPRSLLRDIRERRKQVIPNGDGEDHQEESTA